MRRVVVRENQNTRHGILELALREHVGARPEDIIQGVVLAVPVRGREVDMSFWEGREGEEQ